MRQSAIENKAMAKWPIHCGQQMLYLGDDTAFEPKAGKTNEQKKDEGRGEHYYCELCKSHQWVLPQQGGAKNEQDQGQGTLFTAGP